jgi:hypothetical protein
MTMTRTVVVAMIAVMVATATAIAPPPFVPSQESNMNGKYLFSLTPNATMDGFPAQYKDYPRGVEYFDIYSPEISSLYSQVFWKGLAPVKLPADIVARYAGKGMAVVGFEMDQVRKTANGDVRVPLNLAYNHHFESNMAGAKSRFTKIIFDGPNDPRIAELGGKMAHGIPSHKEHWAVEDLAPGNSIPTSQSFGGANGGEYRLSYHGYAPGYAQVIDSPTEFQITPMQIDTWNRDKMNLTGPTSFVPGPLPRNSLAPPDAEYSGMLECPVTTRIRKIIEGGYTATLSADGCGGKVISTASECFGAAASTLGAGATVSNNFTTKVVNDASKPAGCSAIASKTNPSLITVFYNTHSDPTATCGLGSSGFVSGATKSLVDVRVDLNSKSINNGAPEVTITLAGPSDVWFGVGFNAQRMADSPWAIIVDGTGNVTERKLADQNPGKQLPSSVTLVHSSVTNGLRTVVLTRAAQGKTAEYFTFDPAKLSTLPFINAVGSSPQLSYHKAKTPSGLSVLPVDSEGAGACICAEKPAPFGQGKGKLVYVQQSQAADTGEGTIQFGNNCAPQPRTDLLAMHNPTCDVRTYVGGQIACHHMFSLLDADTDIPWTDTPLKYHLKFRFWVQPYNASYHTVLKRTTWGIASPVEYDVPKCDKDVMGCSQAADGSWIHTLHGTYPASGSLSAAHFHCHAPTCLSMAMYLCKAGDKNCTASTAERLLCREDPVYGGTGKVPNPAFDEPGYILQPPCLWGSEEHGLESPPNVTGRYLHTVKTSNATAGHHGEMAWQQMYFF